MTDRIGVTKASPSTSFYLESDVVESNMAGNYSRVRSYLRCVNAGNTSSFYGSTGFQAGSIDGIGEFGRVTANPFLPSGYAYGQQRWRGGNYDTIIYHAADGTHAAITLRQTLVYGSISESATAALALPTITRPPLAQAKPTLSGGSGTINVSWLAATSYNGAATTGYDVQYSKNADMSAGTIVAVGAVLSTVLSGLDFGSSYFVRTRGKNAAGAGAWSPTETSFVGVGGKRFNGSDYVNFTTAKRFDGTSWVNLTTAKRFDGTSWVNLT